MLNFYATMIYDNYPGDDSALGVIMARSLLTHWEGGRIFGACNTSDFHNLFTFANQIARATDDGC